MASLSLKGISKRYPGGVVAVSDLSLDIEDKEFIVLIGPSGCGKSTILRMIAGLEEITEGDLFIDGRKVNDLPPKDRDIAMVFQSYALYPHMTVFENMAFGLKLRKIPNEEIRRLVEEAADSLDIRHLLDRKPKALSGGQRQRVALGRAIVRDPQVFLLDEPLSNLDIKLRAQMRTELAKLHKRLGTTFVYVTHDQVEAMTMGDRIVVIKEGVIQQVADPANLYEHPVNKFVAGFMGAPQMNFAEAKLILQDGKYTVIFGSEDTESEKGKKFTIRLPDSRTAECGALQNYVDKDVILGIRPEDIHDEEMFLSEADTGFIEAEVDVTEMMGAESYLYLNCADFPMTARVSPRCTARAQDIIKLAIDPNKIHLFDTEDEHSILS